MDAKDRLAGLRAERESLYAQIKAADTQEELDQLRDRLNALQNEIAVAEADFDNVPPPRRDLERDAPDHVRGRRRGRWSLEDALDDAGRVLTVAAGVALITRGAAADRADRRRSGC